MDAGDTMRRRQTYRVSIRCRSIEEQHSLIAALIAAGLVSPEFSQAFLPEGAVTDMQYLPRPRGADAMRAAS